MSCPLIGSKFKQRLEAGNTPWPSTTLAFRFCAPTLDQRRHRPRSGFHHIVEKYLLHLLLLKMYSRSVLNPRRVLSPALHAMCPFDYIAPQWGLVTPFALTSGAQFRPVHGPKRHPGQLLSTSAPDTFFGNARLIHKGWGWKRGSPRDLEKGCSLVGKMVRGSAHPFRSHSP
jgi:hypothetical protein